MLVGTYTIISPKVGRTNSLKQKRRVCVLKCERCQIVYERPYNKKLLATIRHFCGNECSQIFSKKTNYPGHVDRQQRRMKQLKKNNVEKYGVEFNFQIPEIASKIKETLVERYGVDNPLKSDVIRERVQKTTNNKYGVDHVFQADSVKDKIKSTCLERFGVEYAGQAEEIKYKIAETLQKNWGVRSGWLTSKCRASCESQETVNKRKQTMLSTYGVECGFQLEKSRKKQIEFFADKEAVAKSRLEAHLTMKLNNTYATSSIEEQFYAFLCELFGVHDVERQVIVAGLKIDFHVKSIDTYIQFDGVYWHGLDRHIELIMEHKNVRDITISQTYFRDREQDRWFAENNVRLVRVTDVEFLHSRDLVFERFRNLLTNQSII